MSRTLSLLFGLVSYLVAQVSLIYAIGFVGGVVVPKTVDGPGASGSTTTAVIVNLVLLGLFGIQHSGMARKGFKDWWTEIIPEHLERSVYVLLSGLLLLLLYWQWRPMPEIVWSVEHPVGATLLWILFGAGFALAVGSTFLIDHFDLFGLRQVYLRWKGEAYEPVPFQTPGLYDHVRHPLMLGLLLAFWAIPTMTVGHLLFALVTSAYIFVGIYFEERAMVDRFGERYEQYRTDTPMLIPGIKGG